MRIRYAVFLGTLVFAGCMSPMDWMAVDEVEAWNGRPEKWVMHELGKPLSETRLQTPIPEEGDQHGVQRRLQHVAPDYKGEVRLLIWKNHDWNSKVFLYRRGEDWVILDAYRWKDTVKISP